MHEFSICKGLVDAVVGEMAKLDPPPVRLVKARVVVGSMRQIVPEYLEEAYGILTKDTIAEGSTLEIKNVEIQGKCEECGWQGDIKSCDFSCPDCKSDKTEVAGGMELYLDNLEVET